MRVRLALASILALSGLTGCAQTFRPFPLKEPMWRDADAHPFAAEPEEYYSSFLWDGADQMVFRPIARFWAVDPAGKATNVNAMDEVPDSAWFVNRLGRREVTPAELINGPCRYPALDPKGPWVATRAKPNGANPGFIIKGNDGRGYLLKFDGLTQGPRPTSADVGVSKMYYAAGFNPPCNRVVFFDRNIITISPDATSETPAGEKVPMTMADIDKVFDKAQRLPDGRYRGSSSLFLDGKPIGPFRYEGTRDDDPNDVIPHEDRRELRGHRLLAAWTGHTDAREQNTLDMFVPTGDGQGFIRHHIIDFGDCLGSAWEPPMMGRRIQHSAYFDGPEIFQDWVTLGLIDRPWDRLRFGPTGKIFAYFDIEEFDPDEWEPGYPNPAMLRMTEGDAAWMARILARFRPEHLNAVIEATHINDDFLEKELFRLLDGRRHKLLARYLTRLSPLADPEIKASANGGADLCMEDLGITARLFLPERRQYRAKGWITTGLREVAMAPPAVQAQRKRGDAHVCVRLPRTANASPQTPQYVIVDLTAQAGSSSRAPARVHMYYLGGSDYRIVGLQRPEDDEPPGAG